MPRAFVPVAASGQAALNKLLLAATTALLLSPSIAIAKPKAAPVAISLPAPKPSMGQVVFFRPGGMGSAIRCTVRENGKMVGRVHGNRYYVIDATPGVHTFTAKNESTDAVTVQVEPDVREMQDRDGHDGRPTQFVARDRAGLCDREEARTDGCRQDRRRNRRGPQQESARATAAGASK